MKLTIEIKGKIEEKKIFKRNKNLIDVKILTGLLYYLRSGRKYLIVIGILWMSKYPI
jgi:hypothetical protein